ncbi:hypothetical protein KJ762_05680 [bacterium]|nr:hypothetical protein [bacterium]MBU1064015.1 hypothetical protein [bacterium]MBU1633985.1 hypothetical protein [bacterium]MBU1874215.1 hypothetical protein [bacterium]
MKKENLLLLFFALLFFVFCENSVKSSDDSINFRTGTLNFSINMTTAPAEVVMLKGYLIKSGYDTIAFSFDIYSDSAVAMVDEIPVGAWNLHVDAYDDSGNIIYVGSTTVVVEPGIIVPINLHMDQNTGGILITVTWGTNEYTKNIYYEDFEEEIMVIDSTVIDSTSYLKICDNGWNIYCEDTYDEDTTEFGNPSSEWKWLKTEGSFSGQNCIRGITDVAGKGSLWFFKSFEIQEEKSIVVSVYAKTMKVHSGSATGPALYLFNGNIELPSQTSTSLMGSDIFIWESSYWSPWTEMKIECQPNQKYITVGLMIRDGWGSYTIYHDFDALRIDYVE